ncbi:hypothetical protein E1A91_A05G316200v1 [Gossypium mustelinum]|uniref:Uncharacterized protein n=1 Tax=Gossypium mustelinum TaxID=34275 RepID=A0A5D2ZFT7_GOSMU|nr:hypothetical protein E1A91_A05G316200v1 [Gossypium mustelinum]
MGPDHRIRRCRQWIWRWLEWDYRRRMTVGRRRRSSGNKSNLLTCNMLLELKGHQSNMLPR